MELTYIMNKQLLMAGVAAASVISLAASTPALATTHAQITDHKVGICHATGSKTNPYVFIVVDKHAAEAHKNHQGGRDVIGVTSADKCPKPEKGEVKGTSTTPTPSTSPATGKGGPVPTTLPDTGASTGLSFLLGAPALALAGRAYLRSRA
jgi:hypothetical protein